MSWIQTKEGSLLDCCASIPSPSKRIHVSMRSFVNSSGHCLSFPFSSGDAIDVETNSTTFFHHILLGRYHARYFLSQLAWRWVTWWHMKQRNRSFHWSIFCLHIHPPDSSSISSRRPSLVSNSTWNQAQHLYVFLSQLCSKSMKENTLFPINLESFPTKTPLVSLTIWPRSSEHYGAHMLGQN